MPRIIIDGIGIDYEIHGPEGGKPVILTPGGRFTMDTPGVREYATQLAKGGMKAVIWNRPNCGSSDTCLRGETESEMQAEVLGDLIRALDLGPTVIAGGSGGARVSMLAAARNPDICSHLAVWWISGDPIGLMQLATYYCGEAADAASKRGMAGVLEASSWAEHVAANPAARDTLLAMRPERFIATMQKWASAYVYSQLSPVPGMTPGDFARLTMPVLVFRGGWSDLSHTRATSEWVARLIPHCSFIDPPWGDTEWNDRSKEQAEGKGITIFTSWPRLAPHVIELAKQ